MVLRDLPEGRVGRADDREDFGQGGERHLRAAVLAGNGNTAQTTAGELLDLRPGQLALLVALGGLYARGLGQLMGRAQRLGIVAQHNGRQQQGSDVQITLGGC
jgi:hypothetical protein